MVTVKQHSLIIVVCSLWLIACTNDQMVEGEEVESKAEVTGTQPNQMWFDQKSPSSIVAEAFLRGGLPGTCVLLDLYPKEPQMWHPRQNMSQGGPIMGMMIDDFRIRMAPRGIPQGKTYDDLQAGEIEHVEFAKKDLEGCQNDQEAKIQTCTYFIWSLVENVTKIVKIDTDTKTVLSLEVINDLAIDEPKTALKCTAE